MARTFFLGVILFILAIILPPLAVLIDEGCGAHFFISIILTCLAYIPGIIHAMWLCFCREKSQIIIHNNLITHVNP